MSQVTQEQLDAAAEKMREKYEQARPTDSLVHRLASHMLPSFPHSRMTINLIDGTKFENVGADFFYTDGLSTVVDGERIFVPLSAIAFIKHLKPEMPK